MLNIMDIIYDNDDLHKVVGKKWRACAKGYISCTVYLGKINGKYKNKIVYLHRLIANCPDGMQVDHINGNKMDNRKLNLRICNNQQNNRNTKSRKGSTSQYKGVSWDKSNKKWLAQICIGNRKHKKLGRFISEVEAAKAYNNAASFYFGEYAYLNKL